MTIVLGFVIWAYAVLLLVSYIAWKKLPAKAFNARRWRISVVVAARNEATHIPSLIHSLSTQTYADFEVIIIDDHSSDQTADLIRSCGYPFVRYLLSPGQGKKSALVAGIGIAQGELIVTTDADCTPPATWLQSINERFTSAHNMLIGPVVIASDGKLLSALQQLEFASIIGMTAAWSKLGIPIMCNGANLAFLKSRFMEVGGYEGNMQIASGDDEFLLRKFQKLRGKISFVQDERCLVVTQPQPNLLEFYMQRVRWASKWKHNSSLAASILAVFIFAVQLSTLLLIFTIVQSPIPNLSLLAVKLGAEAMLILSFARFLKIRAQLHHFLLLQIAYPLYVLLVAVRSFGKTYRWRGRRYTT